MLGDAINTVAAIYGIRFSILYEGDDLDAASVNIKFNDSWISSSIETIGFDKNFDGIKRIDAAFVRTDKVNVAGDGQIGTLGIVVVDNIAGKIECDPIMFTIVDARAITVEMDELSILTEALEVETETSIYEDGGITGINIYPNPASDIVYLNYNEISTPELITLYDVAGKQLRSFSNKEILNGELNIQGIATGQYILKAEAGKSGVVQTMLIIQ